VSDGDEEEGMDAAKSVWANRQPMPVEWASEQLKKAKHRDSDVTQQGETRQVSETEEGACSPIVQAHKDL